jgi:tRNA uridine 5-carboxymethylaminomethyl modification enzyme
VLVDDLVTRGTAEPYRMFTSRAEHRLVLREDNADLRLTALGRELGLIDDERWAFFELKRSATEAAVQRLRAARLKPGDATEWAERVLGAPLTRDSSAFDLLRRPEVEVTHIDELGVHIESLRTDVDLEALDDRLPREVRLQLEVRAKYCGYIERQQLEIERQRSHEDTRLPADLDFSKVAGLSHEIREKLARARPGTVGQAARVPGVTPAAISNLLIHLKKRSRAA